MKKSFYIALFSALLTAGLIKAAPAIAQPVSQGDAAISLVRTSDLNLGSATGQRRLDIRIAHAAREVCGPVSDADLKGKNTARACREDTIARAHLQKTAILASTNRGATIAVTASR